MNQGDSNQNNGFQYDSQPSHRQMKQQQYHQLYQPLSQQQQPQYLQQKQNQQPQYQQQQQNQQQTQHQHYSTQQPIQRGMYTNTQMPQYGQDQLIIPQNAGFQYSQRQDIPFQGQQQGLQMQVNEQNPGQFEQQHFGQQQDMPMQAFQAMGDSQYGPGSKKWSQKARKVIENHGQAFLNEKENQEWCRTGYLYNFSVGAALLTFPLSFNFARQISIDKTNARKYLARNFMLTVSGMLLIGNAIYRQGQVEEKYAQRYLWSFSENELQNFDHNLMMNVQRINNIKNQMGQNTPKSFGSSDLPPMPENMNPQQMEIFKQMQQMDRIDTVKAIHWEAADDGQPKK